MSSREIAELTGKQHGHVMRDIREMLADLHGEANVSIFGAIEKDGRNRDQPVFKLPKRESLILVSGYDLTMWAAIIDRWQLLESQTSPAASHAAQALVSRMALVADFLDGPGIDNDDWFPMLEAIARVRLVADEEVLPIGDSGIRFDDAHFDEILTFAREMPW